MSTLGPEVSGFGLGGLGQWSVYSGLPQSGHTGLPVPIITTPPHCATSDTTGHTFGTGAEDNA